MINKYSFIFFGCNFCTKYTEVLLAAKSCLSIFIFFSAICLFFSENNYGQEEDLEKQLFDAVKKLNFAKLETLVKTGININAVNDEGHTVLDRVEADKEFTGKHFNLYDKYEAAERLLIEAGAQHSCIEAELAISAHIGDINLVRALIKKGADVNSRVFNETPLYLAISKGNVGVVDELLRAGANINERYVLWESPLKRAETCLGLAGCEEIVRLLKIARANE